MTIARIIASRANAEIISCSADMTVREAIALLAEKRIGALPVCEDEAVIGIFSERDVIYNLRSSGAQILEWPVERIMTAPAITVTADKEVMGALSMMTRRRIRHLPVVDGDGLLVSIVSIGDLVKHRIDRIESEAEALRTYIQMV